MKRLLLQLHTRAAPLPSRLRVGLAASTRTLCAAPTPAPPPAAKPTQAKDALFLCALQTYHSLEGHFSVPNEFVVPADAAWPPEVHGMDLGRRLRLFTRGRCGEYKRSLLKGIGFPYDDWRTYVWEQQIVPALLAFRALEGHLFVRQVFDVPTGDDRWPRSTWGFKLGSHCQLLRREKHRTLLPEQIAELDQLGFIWSETEWKRAVFALPALATFREIFGHSDVPERFVVPTRDARWPEKTWGFTLGRTVALIRRGDEDDLSPAHRSDLEALGFHDEQLVARVWRTRVLPALEAFARVHGHGDVPANFVVPNEAPWPPQASGLQLGYIVASINTNGVFVNVLTEDKMRLKELGYRWEALFGKWSKQLLPALRRFYEVHEHCDVPQMFQVPTNDPTWPEHTWGYRLGKQVSLLRRGGREAPDVLDVLEELDAMGFSFNVIESAFVQKVLPALEVYSQQYGDCNVPQGFVVPSDDAWPRRSWGIKLGHIIRNIRSRKQHAEQVEEHRERLVELGFVWRLNQSTEATNRDVVQPYLEIFEQIYGGVEVPREFVVPSADARWPVAAHGFKLGAWLQRYNQRDAGLLPFQTKEGRLASQKRQRPSDAAAAAQEGLSPFQDAYWREVLLGSFEAYASLHGGSCATMDLGFVVPSEAPFPQSAWGLNLGLRLRHIRHGERYAEEVSKYRAALERLGVLSAERSDEAGDGSDDEDVGAEDETQ